MVFIRQRLVSVSPNNSEMVLQLIGSPVYSMLLLRHFRCAIIFYRLNSLPLPHSRLQEGKKEETHLSKGMTWKLSLLLISHWPEPSHVVPASCKEFWEMLSLSGKQFAELILLIFWRLERQLAVPTIST